jgi:26S proteasome regulatory subunit N2
MFLIVLRYWFPCSHFLSLAFTPTAVIGLNQDLQMPSNWTFLSNAKPSLFAYQPPTEIKKAVEVAKAPVAQLSVSAKGKGKKKDAMEVEIAAPAPSSDKMEVDSKPAEGSVEGAPAPAPVEPVPEPLFERLSNPSRATHSQARVLAVDTAQRYLPLVGTSRPLSGFVMLRDTQPEVAEELIKQVQPKTLAPDEEEEANAPEPFEFTR